MLQFGACRSSVAGHQVQRRQLIPYCRDRPDAPAAPARSSAWLVVIARSCLRATPSCRLAYEIVGVRFQFLSEGDGRARPCRRWRAGPCRNTSTHREACGFSSTAFLRSTRRLGKFLRVHFGGAQQQARFGGIAFAQDAVHQHLAPRRLLVPDQRRAQQVDQAPCRSAIPFPAARAARSPSCSRPGAGCNRPAGRSPGGCEGCCCDRFVEFLGGVRSSARSCSRPAPRFTRTGRLSRLDVRAPAGIRRWPLHNCPDARQSRAQIGSRHHVCGSLFQVSAILADRARPCRRPGAIRRRDAESHLARWLRRGRAREPDRQIPGLPRALIRSPLRQGLTNRRSSSAGRKSSSPRRLWNATLPVLPDQVHAAGPRLVGLLGGAVHAVHHGGERQAQLAQAERGMLLLFGQRPRWQPDAIPSRTLMVLCHWLSGPPCACASRM